MDRIEEIKKLKDIMEFTRKRISELEEQEKAESEKEPEITFSYKEKYYMIKGNFKILTTIWENDNADTNLLEIYNAFKANEKEIAERIAEKIKFLLKLEYYKRLYDADFVPDWEDSMHPKYYVSYDNYLKKFTVEYIYTHNTDTVYFSTRGITQKVCDILNEE